MKKASGLEPQVVREAFSNFPSGVAAIAAMHHGAPHVIVASSFSVGVSLDPPLAAFYVQKTSATWETLVRVPRLGVSVLGVEHATICRQLTAKDRQSRFRDVQTSITEEGAVHLIGSPIWFDCTVFDVHPAGDHYAVQLLIHDLKVCKEQSPLIFHGSRFTRLACAQAAYA